MRTVFLVPESFAAKKIKQALEHSGQRESTSVEFWNIAPILGGSFPALNSSVDRFGRIVSELGALDALLKDLSRDDRVVLDSIQLSVSALLSRPELTSTLNSSPAKLWARTFSELPIGPVWRRSLRSIRDRIRVKSDRSFKEVEILHLDRLWVGPTSYDVANSVLKNARCVSALNVRELDLVKTFKVGVSESGSLGRPLLVDQIGPKHPDFNGVSPEALRTERQKAYSESLIKYLHVIENSLGTEIDVLPHPRNSISNAKAMYPGFRLVSGQTEELVSRASLIIIPQTSLVTLTAVAALRPVLFLHLLPVDSEVRGTQERISRVTGIPILEQGKTLVALERALSVDKKRYESFTYTWSAVRGKPLTNGWMHILKEKF